MSKVLFLSGSEIKKLFKMSDALKVVERAFRLQAEGKVIMPPKLYLNLREHQGDFRAMPAYIEGSVGIKWVSAYPGNSRYNLPTVMATIILCEPSSGKPLAIMDGTYITGMRTGAAGGIAVKYLAREGSSTVGIIGAGMQGKTQLIAISEVLPRIEEVKVFDQYQGASLKYAAEMEANLNLNIRPVDTIAEAAEADIVVTATPSGKPIIGKHHIRPGTHINAIGADAKGKQELEADLLRSARIVVDDIEQASHSGVINVPLSDGALKVEDIYGTIGEIVAGLKEGRQNEREITVFDSTGLATQDIICAKFVYEKAAQAKTPPRFSGGR